MKPLRADAQRNRTRILDAATEVFADQGASASTEEVAARAGVAIGTVFRHFPTKPELLKAVVMGLQDRLVADADALASAPDGVALRVFCARVLSTATDNRATFQRLAETGARVHVGDALGRLRPAVDDLVNRARKAGAVRADLLTEELIALLSAVCQEAMAEGWGEEFRERVLGLLFEGLSG